MDRQREIINGLLELIEIELKLCFEKDINKDIIERCFLISLDELKNALITCSTAEYFLVNGKYDMAKLYNKKYRNILKELL